MMDVMVDMETLSTSLDTVILTLGAVKFDPFSLEEPSDPIYIRFDLEDQEKLGRTIDESTLEWWGRQGADVLEEAFSDEDRVSLTEGIDDFHKWYWSSNNIWSNGSIFDVMILENVYAQLRKPIPWHYYQVRDVRTIFNLGIDPGMNKDSLHHALADAYEQATAVQRIFAELGLSRG